MQTQLLDQKHVQLYAVVDSYGIRRAIFTREIEADEFLGSWNKAEKQNLARLTIVTAKILDDEDVASESDGVIARTWRLLSGRSGDGSSTNGDAAVGSQSRLSGSAGAPSSVAPSQQTRDLFAINPVVFSILALCVVFGLVKKFVIDPSFGLSGQVFTGQGLDQMPIGPINVDAGCRLEWECEKAPVFIALNRIGHSGDTTVASSKTILGTARKLQRRGTHTFAEGGMYTVEVDEYLTGKWRFIIRPPE